MTYPNDEPAELSEQATRDINRCLAKYHAKCGRMNQQTGLWGVEIILEDFNNLHLPVNYTIRSARLSNGSAVHMFLPVKIGRPYHPNEVR